MEGSGVALPPDPHLFKKYVSPPPPPPPAPSLVLDGAAEWADGVNSCHVQPNTEYDGQFVVHWGDGHMKARPSNSRPSFSAALTFRHSCSLVVAHSVSTVALGSCVWA